MAHNVAEAAAFCAQHAESPTRLGGHVDHVGNGQLWRCRQAVFQVFMALAEDLQIKRDDECRAIGCFGPVNQPLNKVTVF